MEQAAQVVLVEILDLLEPLVAVVQVAFLVQADLPVHLAQRVHLGAVELPVQVEPAEILSLRLAR
jgi:hypothetical protein